jgi:RNA polymerase sigma-70 factor (ECF subfamily)
MQESGTHPATDFEELTEEAAGAVEEDAMIRQQPSVTEFRPRATEVLPCVTELISRWHTGDETAGENALALVYGELRALAGRYLRHERAGHTLQATALVHEAYLRLARGKDPDVRSRSELIGIAARLMRQILVNHAHHRRTLRRGGDRARVALDPALAMFEDRCVDLLGLDDALDRLAALDARQARVVELRFFGGMTVEETARAMGTSARTVEREWTLARAWLRREMAA